MSSKMNKKEQSRIAQDFKAAMSLIYSSQVQDVMNCKALEEDKETNSYQLLYKFDDLLAQLHDTACEYVKELEKEQKITKELEDSLITDIKLNSYALIGS